jgi:hypothetical protein
MTGGRDERPKGTVANFAREACTLGLDHPDVHPVPNQSLWETDITGPQSCAGVDRGVATGGGFARPSPRDVVGLAGTKR